MPEIADLPLTSPQVGDGFIVRRGTSPALVELPDFSGGSAPHTHPISDVTGLQAALDGKQISGSYATGAQGALADTALQPLDVSLVATTGLYADLLSVPATFPPSTHNHIISDTTGLQAALDGKASALGVDDNYVTDTEKKRSLASLAGLTPETRPRLWVSLGLRLSLIRLSLTETFYTLGMLLRQI